MNILIIEDDADMLAYLVETLSEEGFVIDSASDGALGLKKALSHPYDLIVLDYSLPSKSGKEICRALRTAHNNTRILLLSATSDPTTKTVLLDAGADDYLTKPFTFGELRARIQAILRRPEPIREEILTCCDLVLDTRRHEASYQNKPLVLTPKEFMLLTYLIQNKGMTVSRMSILEHVWGVYADPFSNTLETHILNIRKKLGSESLIRTISGVGYKIG